MTIQEALNFVSQQPNNAEARLQLGVLLHDAGRFADAVEVYRIGLAQNPKLADLWSNLANTLIEMNLLDPSITASRQALSINPNLFSAHNNLANALGRQGNLAAAAAHYRAAITINPNFPIAHNNLGTVLHAQGSLDAAAAHFRRALELFPDYADAHNNLGSLLADQCRFPEAISQLTRAISLRPDDAPPHWNLGLILLQQGDMARGWPEYEWRRRVKGLIVPQLDFTRPHWQGEPLGGKRILLHTEQGFGDAIQFARYAPLVANSGGRVLLFCPPELVRLLGRIEGIEETIGWNQTLPEFDLHCPLLSLPTIFKTTLATLPATVPYLSPEPALAEKWQERLANDPRKKIGLAWAGRPTHTKDHTRSIPLAAFAPLAPMTNVHFFSLQKGDAANQTTALPLTDWTGELTDFADTAALVNNLDLVITADTAIAHLAGALAKPVWLLLPFAPDFRWMLNRLDSPWYPTMRLFRQTRPGDWKTPIDQVAHALRTTITSSSKAHE